MIYNFTIAITRIHFTICKVQNNNSNPEVDQSFLLNSKYTYTCSYKVDYD